MRTQRRGLAADERGQATFSLIVVLVVVAAAALLLQRTASTAESINAKAENIAQTGRGINTATDAVLQLDVTNQRAGSILTSAKPLEGQLNEVIRLAESINGLAGSINGTAGSINGLASSINGSATQINSIARGVNADTASILNLGQQIDNGVKLINRNLDTTIDLATRIHGDTSTIVGQAQRADQLAAEINDAVNILGGRGLLQGILG